MGDINIQSWAHGFYPLIKKPPRRNEVLAYMVLFWTIKFTMKKEHSWYNNMFQVAIAQ
jgi:hypothetical protein